MSTTTVYPRKDSQRSKLYRAERKAEFTDKPGVGGFYARQPMTPAEAEVYAQRVYDWFVSVDRTDRDRGQISFKHNRGQGGAWANLGRHEIMLTTRREPWLLIHEVAHLCPYNTVPKFDGDRRSHGWAFADHYLAGVQHFLGVDNANALRAAFKEQNVRFRPKRKVKNRKNPNTLPKREKATHVYVARYEPNERYASDAHIAKYASCPEMIVYTETYNKVFDLDRWQEGWLRGRPLFRVSRESLIKAMDRIHWEKPGEWQQYRIQRVPRERVERDETDALVNWAS